MLEFPKTYTTENYGSDGDRAINILADQTFSDQLTDAESLSTIDTESP